MDTRVIANVLSSLMASPTLDMGSKQLPEEELKAYIDLGIRVIESGASAFGSVMIPYSRRGCNVGFSEGEFMPLTGYLASRACLPGIKTRVNESVLFHDLRILGYEFVSCDFNLQHCPVEALVDFCTACTVAELIPMPNLIFETPQEAFAPFEFQQRQQKIEAICSGLDNAGLGSKHVVLSAPIFHLGGLSRDDIIQYSYALYYPFIKKFGAKLYMRGIEDRSRIQAFAKYVRGLAWPEPGQVRVSAVLEPTGKVMSLYEQGTATLAKTELCSLSRILAL